MIKNNEKFGVSDSVTIAEFGNGDISVGAMYMQEDKCSYLAISNLLNPLAIGEVNKERVDKDIREFKNELILKFSKIESIDVMIYQLIELKNYMMQDKIKLEIKILQNK